MSGNSNMMWLRGESVVDISAAADTSAFSIDTPFAGYIDVSQCWASAEEATGSQTSAQGVVSIEVGGTEIATLTADQSQSIGHTQKFTVDGTNTTAANPFYKFAAGTTLEAVTKTQASGGTTTGTYRVHLALNMGE